MLRLVVGAVFALLAALLRPCDATVLHLDPVAGSADLLAHADVLRDPTGRWTLADVIARDAAFLPASTVVPDPRAGALAPSTLWFRVRLGRVPGAWFLHSTPQLDRGEVIVAGPGGAVARTAFGTMLPYAKRAARGWSIDIAPLPPAATAGGTTYIRTVVREDRFGGFALRPAIYEATTGRRRAQDALTVELVTTGMILALGLFNGVLGLTLRDRVYLWYAAAMGAFALYQLVETELAWRWLWPFASLAYDPVDYLCFLTYLALVAAFARAFLDLPRVAPIAWRIIVGTGAFVAIEECVYAVWPNALDASGLTSSLDPLASAAFLVAVFFAGVAACRRGDSAARLYCIAFAGVTIGLIVGASGNYGIIPETGLTDAAPGAGVAWEALFLSVALADRIRTLSAKAALLEGEREALQTAAFRDALTGVPNRRAFEARFDEDWRRGTRSGERLAVVLIDVDHFKAYNDAYGHVRGDRVLARVASAIAGALRRPDDFAARYGGEEFVIILPCCAREDAARIAESIRLAVRELGIAHAHSEFGCVTISAGVAATVPKIERRPGALIAAADRMLYTAKNEGRDRVAVAARPLNVAP